MFCPLAGLLGTFLAASAAASDVLFSGFQGTLPKKLGWPVLSLGAQGFGAAVATIICPHNSIAGGATAKLVGKERTVLSETVVGCLIYTTLGGLVALAWGRFQ